MKEVQTEKERFFSKISHDLRGSFTSILGFSDIMTDPTEDLTDNEKADFVNRISKQSKDTFDLLVNFINWLKLENYDYGLVNEKLEVLECLIENKSNHQKIIKAKNLTFQFDINENEFVKMDYEILSSILNNIFIFLIKLCSDNSSIVFESIPNEDKYFELSILAKCSDNEVDFLQNIDLKDLNSELSFPIIFAIKFTEQSGGKYNVFVDEKNSLHLSIKLPKE